MPRPTSPSDRRRDAGVLTRTLTPTEEQDVPTKGPPDYAVTAASEPRIGVCHAVRMRGRRELGLQLIGSTRNTHNIPSALYGKRAWH
jgi:hypothetical protein